jgi:hypothetical protein
MPTNSVSEAKAAASSTKVRNIIASYIKNIERTLFLFCSKCKGDEVHRADQKARVVNRAVFGGLAATSK